MPSSEDALSVLIHGPSKVGKSTLSFTAPGPLLVLDAEGSTKFITQRGFNSGISLKKIFWNPLKGPPPRHDGTWDVCVVRVGNWQTLDLAYQHLCASAHDFRSVTLDSITEAQNKCKRNMNVTAMQQQDWGRLLDAMDNLIRGIRDLTLVPENPLQVAVFIAETKMKDGKWRPYMQGAVEARLPYWVDVCGYVMQVDIMDANNQPTIKQVNMICAPNAQYEAGERVQGKLPAIIASPDITAIFHHVYA